MQILLWIILFRGLPLWHMCSFNQQTLLIKWLFCARHLARHCKHREDKDKFPPTLIIPPPVQWKRQKEPKIDEARPHVQKAVGMLSTILAIMLLRVGLATLNNKQPQISGAKKINILFFYSCYMYKMCVLERGGRFWYELLRDPSWWKVHHDLCFHEYLDKKMQGDGSDTCY